MDLPFASSIPSIAGYNANKYYYIYYIYIYMYVYIYIYIYIYIYKANSRCATLRYPQLPLRIA